MTKVTGKVAVANGDKQSLLQAKEQLSNQLTKKLQEDSQNPNAKVNINDVQEENGELFLEFECEGANDADAAKKTIDKAVKQDDIKKTIAKSTQKPKQTTNQPG